MRARSSPLILAIALASLLPSAAFAQTIGATETPFTLSVSPQYPQPYSQVTVSVLSSSLDLTNATLNVSTNNADIYQGNAQPVTVTLGAAGSVTNVTAIIASNGSSYLETVSIQPEDVALVAEPVASAPVLYPGKPSVPLEGGTRVVAVANFATAGGKALDPNALDYTWTVDGTEITGGSGIGKTALVVASPLEYRDRAVSVTVQSQDGALVGGDSLTLTPEEPTVRIYANDPLLGILFDHALADSYAISGSEAALYAAPYSFPTASGAPAVQWFLNDNAAQTGNSITLRPTGAGAGNASLSVTASAGDSTTAAADLSLSFGASSSGLNIFGL